MNSQIEADEVVATSRQSAIFSSEISQRRSAETRYIKIMNTDSPIIEIQNLSRRYGKLDAVNGLSLNVRAGKCYGFFGATARARPRPSSAC